MTNTESAQKLEDSCIDKIEDRLKTTAQRAYSILPILTDGEKMMC